LTRRFFAGLVGLFVCSTMAWLLGWAFAASLWQGSAPVLVASGSMGPSVRAGDLVVLEPYHSQELRPGAVIRFDDPDGRGSLLHRVVEVAEDGTLRTKGDANAVVDASAVDAGRITGVGRVLVPRAGLPLYWWRNGELLALAVFAAVALSALFVARYALLDAYDPWLDPPERAPTPPTRLPELVALGLAVLFLASSTTAWAAYRDTTGNAGNSFAASSLSAPTGLAAVGAGCAGSSTIVFETSTTATNTADGEDVTVTRPLGTQVGDLMVAQVAFHTRDFAGTITAPAGWTMVRVDDDATRTMQGVFWKFAGSSEPTTYTFTNTTGDTGRSGSGAISVFSGVDTSTPIDADGANVYPSNVTSLTAPSVTTTVGGTRLLTLVGQRSDGPITPPTGMAERYEATSSNDNVIEMADQGLTSPGATGTRTATSATSRPGVAQTVALRPQQVALVGTGPTGGAANGAAGTIALGRPSGVVADDVLIAHVALHTHSFDPNPITPPAGWHTIRIDTDANHVTAGAFWKRATGSEPSTYTFTNVSGDSTQQAVGAVMAYRGVDPIDPVDDDAGTTNITGTDNVVAPSVTASRPGARLLSLVAAYGNSHGPATPPGSMTERYEGTEVSESSVVEILGEAADEVLSAAGASGTRTTSVPGTDTSVAQAVVLRAATGEPYADLTWTPSTSPGVDGYLVERRIGGTLDDSSTVTPGTASSTTDGPLVAGTTYTYRVIATAGSWRSAPATVTFTPSAC
jgi:signal peptidase I